MLARLLNTQGLFVYGKVSNLRAFQDVYKIGCSLKISESILETISEFEKLVEIRGDLEIDNNPALTSVTGFEMLQEITGNLEIHNNPILNTIRSFEGIEIKGAMKIQQIHALPANIIQKIDHWRICT